jgi:hypothetical protein
VESVLLIDCVVESELLVVESVLLIDCVVESELLVVESVGVKI